MCNELRAAGPADADAIARVFRAARAGMSYLPDSPYSDAQTAEFFRSITESPGTLVLRIDVEGQIAGFGVFGAGRIDHLYVLPAHQRRGIGSRLISAAQERFSVLEGWVFEKNLDALRLYERHGFTAIEHTDGSSNEEREPDVRILWSQRGHRARAPG